MSLTMQWMMSIFLALHGTVHLIGFLTWSKLATFEQMTGRTLLPLTATGARAFGMAWLAPLFLFLAAAILRFARSDAWWTFAIGGAFLSQLLIGFAWHDAKFGTVANVLILLPAVAAAAHAYFVRGVESEIRVLLARPGAEAPTVVERAELAALPLPVRKWLEASGTVGRQRARTVRLRQRGELRIAPDAAWMPAEAEQYVSVDDPAFIWRVDAKAKGLFPFSGRDKYALGKGHMLIKAASLVTVVNESDEKIAHGAMLRFLAEMVWYPSAALRPYVEWEAIDAQRAKATMRHAGLVASATFTFDENGRIVSLHAERYLGGGKAAKLTPWFVSCSKWDRMDGIEVPVRGEVAWRLDGSDFSYYRWEILDVEYNRAEPYRSASRSPRGALERPSLASAEGAVQ